LGLALNNYHDIYGCFPLPEARNPVDWGPICPSNGFGAQVLMLPLVEQSPLWNHLNQSLPHAEMVIGSPPNYTLRFTVIASLLCPSDPTPPIRSDAGWWWSWPAGFCTTPGLTLAPFGSVAANSFAVSCYGGSAGKYYWYEDGRPLGTSPKSLFEFDNMI